MNPAPSNGRIAIAGAGVAGLSAAIALKLAGYSVEIFEREPELREVGAGLQAGPHATRVMEAWQLDLSSSAVEPEALELRNASSGSLLNTLPLKPIVRERYGAPYITLLRADLQQALLARAAALDVPIHYSAPISKARAEQGRVVLQAGGPDVSAAALIGADGIKSAVRGLLGYNPPRYSAQAVAWRGLLPPDAVPAAMRNAIVLWMGDGAHLTHYPVAGGAEINAVLIIDDVWREDRREQKDAAGYLQRRLAGWAGTPLSIIAAAPSWLQWRMYGVEKWHGGEGRVQLIGDAWHAMRPHLASGAVMAIEDGAALAVSLTQSRGDIVEGFRLFRNSRGPRVWQVARASAQMGRVYHCAPPFSMARDAVLRLSSGAGLICRHDWLYGACRGVAGR
jgi:salicylate hydroxylase